MARMKLPPLLWLSCLCMIFLPCRAFMPMQKKGAIKQPRSMINNELGSLGRIPHSSSPSSTLLKVYNDEEEKEEIEDARVRIWNSRRGEIRAMLRSAEKLRNFRFEKGFIPELDEEGEPIKSDGKTAVTITAFAVAAGAIVLRIGGRAALVSAVGLDFMSENPDLQNQINQILEAADLMDPLLKVTLFCAGWTLVKTLCFDAGGIVLAFSSGILFGGVLQGAVMSAFGATVGSSVAFALAKADTPVRKKAIEIVEDNPSLRGLEKVVADEGLKAVLTLRLAPVLPIPLGMYNYVYGVSNVKYTDFAGGIFLGSLKPYFLDSYLGYFGKSLIDGEANDSGMQDYVLIGVLGFSVLIGVFASQLASETWDAVQKEQEADEKERKLEEGNDEGDNDVDDGITTEVFGYELPQFAVGFQYALQDADKRINTLVLQEFDAKVWNCTEDASIFGMEVSKSDLPDDKNPAYFPNSPEITEKYSGIDFGAQTCDGLILSPILFSYYLQFADPLFDEKEFQIERDEDAARASAIQASATTPMAASDEASAKTVDTVASTTSLSSTTTTTPSLSPPSQSPVNNNNSSLESKESNLLNQLQELKEEAKQRIEEANEASTKPVDTVASTSSLSSTTTTTTTTTPSLSPPSQRPVNNNNFSLGSKESILLNRLQDLKEEAKQRLEEADGKLEQLSNDSGSSQ